MTLSPVLALAGAALVIAAGAVAGLVWLLLACGVVALLAAADLRE